MDLELESDDYEVNSEESFVSSNGMIGGTYIPMGGGKRTQGWNEWEQFTNLGGRAAAALTVFHLSGSM